MEILRFEEAPSDAPKRKKSSRSFLALGLVATLFGVSTAFASSTIQINSGNAIALGQGVSAVLGCDPEVTITPDAGLTTPTAIAASVTYKSLTSNIASLTVSEAHTFVVGETITVSGVDATFNGSYEVSAITDLTVSYAKTATDVYSASSSGTITIAAPAPTFNLARIIVAGIDTTATNPTTGLGCAGVDFKIQVFHTDNSVPGSKTEKAYSCSELGAASIGSSYGDLVLKTCNSDDSAIYFRVAGTDKANGSVTITLAGSSDIDYITLVSTNYAPFDSI
jgi:hypothetical protein